MCGSTNNALPAKIRLGLDGKFQMMRVQAEVIVAHMHCIPAIVRRIFEANHIVTKAGAFGAAMRTVAIRRQER